nr:hypothetical protein CFP56_62647 [Quercus suber]
MTELATLREQMDKAKVDLVAAFRISQPFFEKCGIFYGDGFDDYLKQVTTVYPDLDLSQVVIEDTISLTLGGVDAISEETDDSAHTVEEEVKDTEAEVIVQPAPEGLVALVVLFVVDGISTADGSSTVDSSISNVLPS